MQINKDDDKLITDIIDKETDNKLNDFMQKLWDARPDVLYLAPNKERRDAIYNAIEGLIDVVLDYNEDAEFTVEPDCLIGTCLEFTITADCVSFSGADAMQKFLDCANLANSIEFAIAPDEERTEISFSFNNVYHRVKELE